MELSSLALASDRAPLSRMGTGASTVLVELAFVSWICEQGNKYNCISIASTSLP